MRATTISCLAAFLIAFPTMAIGEIKPPSDLKVTDKGWDDGTRIEVTFKLSPDDPNQKDSKVAYYEVKYSGEYRGLYKENPPFVPGKKNYRSGTGTVVIEKLERGVDYWVRVRAVGKVAAGQKEAEKSAMIQTTGEKGVAPTEQFFEGKKSYFGLTLLIVCGSVVFFIRLAKKLALSGRELKIRKIAGLEAVDEAVGRATEMGRSCMFIPGIQDINDIQTVAGITVLSRVAKTSAQFDAKVEVPTSRSLVMTTARETVQAAFLAAGRPDAYREDLIYYVTDEQFGYVAYLSGHMVREKPAACFYMGSFFAESLILAETGNSIGAIQVAGTAQPAQLPFFVAACDYTLIGEEFFAASAYLSGDPDQLGSLKGQDMGKIIVMAFLLVGCFLATIASFGMEWAQDAVDYIKETILQ